MLTVWSKVLILTKGLSNGFQQRYRTPLIARASTLPQHTKFLERPERSFLIANLGGTSFLPMRYASGDMEDVSTTSICGAQWVCLHLGE